MDFQTAPEILEALEERIQHGILGYSESDKEYADAVVKWYQEHFQWKIERNWIVKTPGVVLLWLLQLELLQTKEIIMRLILRILKERLCQIE